MITLHTFPHGLSINISLATSLWATYVFAVTFAQSTVIRLWCHDDVTLKAFGQISKFSNCLPVPRSCVLVPSPLISISHLVVNCGMASEMWRKFQGSDFFVRQSFCWAEISTQCNDLLLLKMTDIITQYFLFKWLLWNSLFLNPWLNNILALPSLCYDWVLSHKTSTIWHNWPLQFTADLFSCRLCLSPLSYNPRKSTHHLAYGGPTTAETGLWVI